MDIAVQTAAGTRKQQIFLPQSFVSAASTSATLRHTNPDLAFLRNDAELAARGLTAWIPGHKSSLLGVRVTPCNMSPVCASLPCLLYALLLPVRGTSRTLENPRAQKDELGRKGQPRKLLTLSSVPMFRTADGPNAEGKGKETLPTLVVLLLLFACCALQFHAITRYRNV